MFLLKIGFLEFLMGFFKNIVGVVIGVVVFDWLFDINNQKVVKNIIILMVDIMKVVVGFVGVQIKDFIDDMYILLFDEFIFLEKFGVVFERIGKFGVFFLVICYLKNFLKIVNDFGVVLGFFNKNFFNFRNVLICRVSKIVVFVVGVLFLVKVFENKDEIKVGVKKVMELIKEFLQINE